MAKKVKSETADWGQYKQQMITNTDYRKFDEVLRRVLSGTEKQRRALNEYLNGLYQQQKIAFGLHASPSAVVTGLVSDDNNDHVHFLDGPNGGYAMAAKEMKEQIKQLTSSFNQFTCVSVLKATMNGYTTSRMLPTKYELPQINVSV